MHASRTVPVDDRSPRHTFPERTTVRRRRHERQGRPCSQGERWRRPAPRDRHRSINSIRPVVSSSRRRLRPSRRFAPSYCRPRPPTPVVFADYCRSPPHSRPGRPSVMRTRARSASCARRSIPRRQRRTRAYTVRPGGNSRGSMRHAHSSAGRGTGRPRRGARTAATGDRTLRTAGAAGRGAPLRVREVGRARAHRGSDLAPARGWA